MSTKNEIEAIVDPVCCRVENKNLSLYDRLNAACYAVHHSAAAYMAAVHAFNDASHIIQNWHCNMPTIETRRCPGFSQADLLNSELVSDLNRHNFLNRYTSLGEAYDRLLIADQRIRNMRCVIYQINDAINNSGLMKNIRPETTGEIILADWLHFILSAPFKEDGRWINDNDIGPFSGLAADVSVYRKAVGLAKRYRKHRPIKGTRRVPTLNRFNAWCSAFNLPNNTDTDDNTISIDRWVLNSTMKRSCNHMARVYRLRPSGMSQVRWRKRLHAISRLVHRIIGRRYYSYVFNYDDGTIISPPEYYGEVGEHRVFSARFITAGGDTGYIYFATQCYTRALFIPDGYSQDHVNVAIEQRFVDSHNTPPVRDIRTEIKCLLWQLVQVNKSVTLQHSYAAGNCQPGTAAFCRRVGIPQDVNSLPAYDLARYWYTHQQPAEYLFLRTLQAAANN